MAGLTRLSTGNGFPDVVVTGIAMTTSVATDVDGTWKALLEGRSGIRKLEDPFGHVWTIATHIEDVPPEEMKRRAEAAFASSGAAAPA